MWYAKPTGGYANTSNEAQTNARNIANALLFRGWSIKAICALLGNAAGESGLNPWRWEGDSVPTVSEFNNWTPEQATSHGYGLFGFTPASTYINEQNRNTYAANGYAPNFSDAGGSPNDGLAQTLYFVSTVETNWSHSLHDYYYDDFQDIGVNIDDFYYATFDEFKSANIGGQEMSLEDCVGAFELCYEKPADWAAASSYQNRVSAATYWYSLFQDDPPEPVPPIIKRHTLPIWMYGF